MKRTWVFLLFLVPSQLITAQVLSTRLSGMGYVSVAVPDVESEAFLNPARAMRVANAYARMSPLFLRSSEAFEDKSIQYPSNPRHYQRESSGYGFFMPVEILIPFGSFVVGGLLSYRSGNSKYALNYDYIDSDIPSLTTFYDGHSRTARTSGSGGILAATTIGSVNFGFLVNYSSGDRNDESSSRNESSSIILSSHDAFSGREKNITWSGGVLYGSPTSTEVAASGSISLPRTEQTQTVHVWSGVPASWTIAPVTVHDGTESWIRLQVRRSLTTNLLLAVSVSRATSSVSGTVKSDFSSGQQTVYEERKSDALDRVENGLLAGLSWTISEAALISLEYGVSSEERTSTTYNIYSSVLRTDGSPFQIGDQQSKNESKYVWQYFRIGSEMELVEDIKIRLGGEAGWSLGDYSYFYDLGDGSWKETGLTDSFIAVTGGCSWYTGGFRLDYSLGLLPGSGFIPHTEQFSVGTLQRNVIFRHNVTLTHEL